MRQDNDDDVLALPERAFWRSLAKPKQARNFGDLKGLQVPAHFSDTNPFVFWLDTWNEVVVYHWVIRLCTREHGWERSGEDEQHTDPHAGVGIPHVHPGILPGDYRDIGRDDPRSDRRGGPGCQGYRTQHADGCLLHGRDQRGWELRGAISAAR